MHITFPNETPTVTSGGVAFNAIVDGQVQTCLISLEALRDHFGASSMKANDLIHSFIASKDQIHKMARQRLPRAAGQGVHLVSADFGTAR